MERTHVLLPIITLLIIGCAVEVPQLPNGTLTEATNDVTTAAGDIAEEVNQPLDTGKALLALILTIVFVFALSSENKGIIFFAALAALAAIIYATLP